LRDNSRARRPATSSGIAAARAPGGSLQVITVIPADLYGAPAAMAGPSYITVRADIEADIRKDLEDTLAGLPADISVEGIVIEGRPWSELAIKSADLDLLLVGSRGYGRCERCCSAGPAARCCAMPMPCDRAAARYGHRAHDLFTTSATAAA
jgi:nucleotide-binding universal stress UspA family protein